MILTLCLKEYYIRCVTRAVSACDGWFCSCFYELRIIIYAVFCLFGFYFALFSV